MCKRVGSGRVAFGALGWVYTAHSWLSRLSLLARGLSRANIGICVCPCAVITRSALREGLGLERVRRGALAIPRSWLL